MMTAPMLMAGVIWIRARICSVRICVRVPAGRPRKPMAASSADAMDRTTRLTANTPSPSICRRL